MLISPVVFKSQVETNKKNSDTVVKKTKISSFGGSIGALTLGGLVHHLAHIPISLPIANKMMNWGYVVAPEKASIVHNALKEMLVESGLKDKGVRIKFLSAPRIFRKDGKNVEALNGRTLKDYGPLRTFYERMSINSVRKGQNAFFIPKDQKLPKITLSEYLKLSKSGNRQLLAEKFKEKGTLVKGNSVVVSKNYLHTAGFHELGHALNWNFSSIGKILQKCRIVAVLSPVLLGVYGAVSKKSKPKQEGQELTGRQKFNNFLRNNAGKLAFIASLPMLIEEGMATQKGNKFAKKLLSPELANRVLKSNKFAYCTYLISAIFGGLGAMLAVKVKDNAIEKKEIKAELKAKLDAELANVV